MRVAPGRAAGTGAPALDAGASSATHTAQRQVVSTVHYLHLCPCLRRAQSAPGPPDPVETRQAPRRGGAGGASKKIPGRVVTSVVDGLKSIYFNKVWGMCFMQPRAAQGDSWVHDCTWQRQARGAAWQRPQRRSARQAAQSGWAAVVLLHALCIGRGGKPAPRCPGTLTNANRLI
jgi:hypothetical protein